jgi:hypothetical protein
METPYAEMLRMVSKIFSTISGASPMLGWLIVFMNSCA